MAETMALDDALLTCPMCDFTVVASDTYVLQLHFEQLHTTDSPFRIENDPEPLPQGTSTLPSASNDADKNAASDSEDSDTVLCPQPGCGETILLVEYNEHLNLHAYERLVLDDEPPSVVDQYHHPSSHSSSSNTEMQKLSTAEEASKTPSFLHQNFSTNLPDALRRDADGDQRKLKKRKRHRGDSDSSEKTTLSRSILSFNPFSSSKTVKAPASSTRLGRAELGPHAWEDRMPKSIHKQLAEGPRITVVNRIGRDGRLIKHEVVENETPGVIPILAQLSALDRSVKEAYYCHPSTVHICKTPNEGGFCGYRNIQMLISYIQGARAQGYEEFPGRTPGVLTLQDLIERAWDKGINEIGRQQTGGIRDTRKYIGTPEAQALFLSSEIDCAVEHFHDSPDGSKEAHEALFMAIERYFQQAAVPDGSNVYKTLLPPIYLQQPGHSLTIVGFERRRDGTCNLMTFDPMFRTSPTMVRLVGRRHLRSSRPEVLHAYRRTARQLRKHAAFEILMLSAHPPLFPAWDVLRQFPGCRYVYVFFRSRTLGYDVYPEDHFLRAFPWFQYGGLYIIDDARFARADKMSPLTVAALRRLTGEGAQHSTSRRNSAGYCSNSFSSLVAANSPPPHSHSVSAFDGMGFGPVREDELEPLLRMTGMHMAQSTQPNINQPRRFPGYVSPETPSKDARRKYPSPPSASGMASQPQRNCTPMNIDGSEMCGPSRRCTSHNYEHYPKEAWPEWYTNIESSSGSGSVRRLSPPRNPTQEPWKPRAQTRNDWPSSSSTRSASPPSRSPTSPSRGDSPRTTMLRNMYQKQAFQALSCHEPAVFDPQTGLPSLSPPSVRSRSMSTPCSSTFDVSNPWFSSHQGSSLTGDTGFSGPSIAAGQSRTPKPGQATYDREGGGVGQVRIPDPITTPDPLSQKFSNPLSFTQTQVALVHPHDHPPTTPPNAPPNTPTKTSPFPPAIPIANGLEAAAPSPLSPNGTLLTYTSLSRGVDSGLLAVKPLTEQEVAEYRFWRPCGRGRCMLGCGEGRRGEVWAAGRLFREVTEVREEEDNGGEGQDQDGVADRDGERGRHSNGGSEGDGKKTDGRESVLGHAEKKIRDWFGELRFRERDGVADI